MKILIITIFLVSIVFYIFFIIRYSRLLEIEGLTSYECGFDIISRTRNLFSYRFFLISILFLIFDVEIALILPIPYFASFLLGLGFYIFLIFLILGLLYEYYHGALRWL